MWNRIIESVPNISEGRRPEVVQAIVTAAAGPDRKVIDYSMDPDHNRAVITIVGTPDGIEAGIIGLTGKALELIDLRRHTGAHPRMGAVDVVPFVPVRGVTMDDCVTLSRKVGARLAATFNLPVYLYEQSASRPERENLAAIRKGEFEGLAEKMQRPEWAPDFGPPHPHPSGGAVAVGAREFLIAYNIELATSDLSVARKVARAVRHSSGGLRYVKALGFALPDKGIVQVSMNLTNFKKTPILRVFELVKREAARYGVAVLRSELVGMAPRQAVYDVAAACLQLGALTPDQVLEDRIEEALRADS